MENLNEVIEFYKQQDDNKHKKIYESFKEHVNNNSILINQFNNTHGFGEIPFSWNWYLLVKDVPENFIFLEIGVFKGRVLSLIQLLSNMFNKNVQIYGITPLNTASDKYSEYQNCDYLKCIKESYKISNLNFNNTTILHGFSQDENIIKKAQELVYDIIFIDGCHDYDVVCLDIKNYSEMVKIGGYLVLDDASSLLENSYGVFLGHYDVGKAIHDVLEKDLRFVHLYAVGHNRVWKKIC